MSKREIAKEIDRLNRLYGKVSYFEIYYGYYSKIELVDILKETVKKGV